MNAGIGVQAPRPAAMRKLSASRSLNRSTASPSSTSCRSPVAILCWSRDRTLQECASMLSIARAGADDWDRNQMTDEAAAAIGAALPRLTRAVAKGVQHLRVCLCWRLSRFAQQWISPISTWSGTFSLVRHLAMLERMPQQQRLRAGRRSCAVRPLLSSAVLVIERSAASILCPRPSLPICRGGQERVSCCPLLYLDVLWTSRSA